MGKLSTRKLTPPLPPACMELKGSSGSVCGQNRSSPSPHGITVLQHKPPYFDSRITAPERKSHSTSTQKGEYSDPRKTALERKADLLERASTTGFNASNSARHL